MYATACGPHRILERHADLIRPAGLAAEPETIRRDAAEGSTGDGGFVVIPEMMSILGCSPRELGASS